MIDRVLPPVLVPLSALPPSAATLSEACGPADRAGAICVAVYQATDNAALARLADMLLARPLKIVFILALAFVISRLVRRTIRRFTRSMHEGKVQRRLSHLRAPRALATSEELPSLRRSQRAETLGALLKSIANFVIWVTAGLMALGTLGIDLGPLIAGAGIVGVAIGFGAQNLVRDFISGIFMLLEDQYGVGDVIDLGEATGAVEGVGLRTTRVRDVGGILWHVPNGEIRRVGNKSQGWSRALLDIEVAYSNEISTATRVIKQVADELWKDDETYAPLILEEPEVWGVEELGPNGVRVRLVVKTRPLEQWKVARELRARIKAAFEREGVRLPVAAQAVVLHSPEELPATSDGGGGDGPLAGPDGGDRDELPAPPDGGAARRSSGGRAGRGSKR
ncbi:MAG TPA: mechanosensitive ion channel family protein [Actinomycetes bacterium]